MSASLLERVARCERDAFPECIDRYGGLVWSLARRHCRDHAEDAVQEAFLALWKSAHRFDPAIAKEATFVAMVSRRRMIDLHREVQRHHETTRSLERDAAHVHAPRPASEAPDAAAETSTVSRLLATLKDEQRSVLTLQLFEGLSQSEIADRLDMPIGTVKSHARRGLLDLRKRVGEVSP